MLQLLSGSKCAGQALAVVFPAGRAASFHFHGKLLLTAGLRLVPCLG